MSDPVNDSTLNGRPEKSRRDPLDDALASLPRDLPPSRDLWQDISTTISSAPPSSPRYSITGSPRWLQLAAVLLLVVASSLTTYFVMQQRVIEAQEAAQRQLLQAPAVSVMPASFGGQEQLGEDYQRARAALDAEFQRRIAALPPVTRAKLERDLADMRRAANEISATLAEHPNHPLLQELLLSTYQSELALLAGVNEMTATAETRL